MIALEQPSAHAFAFTLYVSYATIQLTPRLYRDSKQGGVSMPIYEYRCNSCKRVVSILVRGFSEAPEVSCNACGSGDLTRLMSRFSVVKSDHDRMGDVLEDSALVKGLERNDPRALAEWSRRMGQEGGTVPSAEFNEMMERLDSGEMPSDWGGAGDAGFDDDFDDLDDF